MRSTAGKQSQDCSSVWRKLKAKSSPFVVVVAIPLAIYRKILLSADRPEFARISIGKNPEEDLLYQVEIIMQEGKELLFLVDSKPTQNEEIWKKIQ